LFKLKSFTCEPEHSKPHVAEPPSLRIMNASNNDHHKEDVISVQTCNHANKSF